MGKLSAQILVGPRDRDFEPSHAVWLFEDSRPSWILQRLTFTHPRTAVEQIRWIPTRERPMEDALLMIALHVLEIPDIVIAAQGRIRNPKPHSCTLPDDVAAGDLQQLRELCRQFSWPCKLVVTVLSGSLLADRTDCLMLWGIPSEVCIPAAGRRMRR